MKKNEALMMLLKAKQAHLEWRSHAENLIKGAELNEARAPVDANCCDFSKWYEGAARECLGFLRHYKLVAEAHHVMHAVYREIYDHVLHHNFAQAREKLLQLAEASDTLLGSIELLEQELMAAPECPD